MGGGATCLAFLEAWAEGWALGGGGIGVGIGGVAMAFILPFLIG